MTINDFLHKLHYEADAIEFNDTMAVIDENYHFQVTAFKNGSLLNEEGENSGSCKLFAFAQLQQLSQQQTLDCFGTYYRVDVVNHPEADNHQNIRNFMRYSWSGIEFAAMPLSAKK